MRRLVLLAYRLWLGVALPERFVEERAMVRDIWQEVMERG